MDQEPGNKLVENSGWGRESATSTSAHFPFSECTLRCVMNKNTWQPREFPLIIKSGHPGYEVKIKFDLAWSKQCSHLSNKAGNWARRALSLVCSGGSLYASEMFSAHFIANVLFIIYSNSSSYGTWCASPLLCCLWKCFCLDRIWKLEDVLLFHTAMPVICPSELQHYGSSVNKQIKRNERNWEQRMRREELKWFCFWKGSKKQRWNKDLEETWKYSVIS